MLNVEHTINSGQVFLWDKKGPSWYGVNGQDVIRVDGSGRTKSYSGTDYDFFRDGDDYNAVIRQISKDPVVGRAAREFAGLRLLRQDPFQCYISFIVSANSNIQNIRRSLGRIARTFGRRVIFDGMEFFLFPKPTKIAAAAVQELASCGLGYRTRYVKNAAAAVQGGSIDFDYLTKADYHTARDALCEVDGIGNKVADCIMLFSLEKTEAFPLDRWILRSLRQHYPETFSFGATLTDRKYRMLHDELAGYFGRYAGYCQQFLFKMVRETSKKGW